MCACRRHGREATHATAPDPASTTPGARMNTARKSPDALVEGRQSGAGNAVSKLLICEWLRDTLETLRTKAHPVAETAAAHLCI